MQSADRDQGIGWAGLNWHSTCDPFGQADLSSPYAETSPPSGNGWDRRSLQGFCRRAAADIGHDRPPIPARPHQLTLGPSPRRGNRNFAYRALCVVGRVLVNSPCHPVHRITSRQSARADSVRGLRFQSGKQPPAASHLAGSAHSSARARARMGHPALDGGSRSAQVSGEGGPGGDSLRTTASPGCPSPGAFGLRRARRIAANRGPSPLPPGERRSSRERWLCRRNSGNQARCPRQGPRWTAPAAPAEPQRVSCGGR